MKRNIFKLMAVLALLTGFVVAQNPGPQDRRDPSQQTPQAQQSPQSQSPTSAGNQNVQAQIQQQPELSNVTVNETSDKIELSGTVNSSADKEKAKSIAESSAGGRKVVNKIKVSESQSNSSTPSPK